jgi:hypothetical protein
VNKLYPMTESIPAEKPLDNIGVHPYDFFKKVGK